jgi:glycosyltransferase involved in cell wall biosynthesis
MKQSDCGVFPSRAEGWNLELLEMMACGKQVIATNYSAHTEFCSEDNSYLIHIEDLETAYDGVFFNGSHGRWAALLDSQKEQMVTHMRAVHAAKQSGVLHLNEFGIETSKLFSWNNSAREVINGL